MAGTLALIEKYKARLDPQQCDFQKIFRALQKLNEIDVTVDLLRQTGVGRAVHKLRKAKGLGEIARQIVSKWKKIASIGVEIHPRPKYEAASSKVKSEPCQYSPSSNWNLQSSEYDESPYRPAKSSECEATEGEEYDPSQNWQVDAAQPEPSKPSYEPVHIKKEVSSKSKKKSKNRGCEKSSKMSEEIDRGTVKSNKVKQKHYSSSVKVEPVSPTRYETAVASSEEDVEEYDPSSNYELSNNSPVTHDPQSDQESEDETQECHEEYDPGPSNSNYKPSANLDNRDSENSYDENEPGAYLLHPTKATEEYSQRYSSQESEMEENTSDSFVQSTTLYSRNKSVDSEDGTWGSKVNGRKHKDVKEQFKSSEKRLSPKKSLKSKTSSLEPKNLKVETITKPEKHKKHKSKTAIVPESSKIREKSKKRKSTPDVHNEPEKKKSKPKVKVEKPEVREANFLFESIPLETKLQKKKLKKKVKPTSDNHSSVKGDAKLNLKLPKIQASYRPLPQPEISAIKRKDSGLTDSQAAELHSKRQTKKMLVYSGGGGGSLSKMTSLYNQCMAVLMNNIDAIDSFGGIPYEIVQPILKKCNAEQLYRLEDSNPYLLEDTDYLWAQHCAHDFRSKKPSEMESWREMYLRLSDERETRLASLTQMISMKEAKKKPLEKKVMLAYVGANAKPPRSVRRAQEKFGTAGRSRPSSSASTSSSSMRRDLVKSRMAVPVGSITAASVDREARMHQVKDLKKSRIAPMMAKTLKSIGKTRYRR